MITIYVLDIPKYSFIILYSDNQKKYAKFFFGTLMTRRSEKNDIFWTSEGGNSFRKYFKNKPGNLISNFLYFVRYTQRTIHMKFKKIH
jgi:predicted peroxiredoxin